jgi:hypothetical protein
LEVLTVIAKLAQSEYLLLLILLIAACVLVFIPLYKVILANRRSKEDMYNLRERNLLEVIANNSEAVAQNSQVIADLRSTIEHDNIVRLDTIQRIHERLDRIVAKIG